MRVTINLTSRVEELLQHRVDDYNTNVLPTVNGVPFTVELEAQYIFDHAITQIIAQEQKHKK